MSVDRDDIPVSAFGEVEMDEGGSDMLLDSLRRIAGAVDATPESVFVAAQAAFLTRNLDAEIAVLIADSRSGDGESVYEPIRADEDPREGRWMLSFEGGGIQVDMEVTEERGRLGLVGQFSGASVEDVRIESSEGQRPVVVDGLGRFIVDDVTHGPVRLRCRSADGIPIITAWVRI